MTNLNRLNKLEKKTNENRRQRRQRPLTDYSHLSDDELNNLYQGELEKMLAESISEYEGMTDEQLSDLYLRDIKEGNDRAKNSKKVK